MNPFPRFNNNLAIYIKKNAKILGYPSMLLLPKNACAVVPVCHEIEEIRNKLVLGRTTIFLTHVTDRPILAKDTLWSRRRNKMFGTTALSFYDHRSTKSHSTAPTCDPAPQA
jgi:hypothetical protein